MWDPRVLAASPRPQKKCARALQITKISHTSSPRPGKLTPPHKNLPPQTPCMHVARFPRTRIHVGKHGSSNPAIRALCPSAAPKDARTPRVQRHPTLRPNLRGRSSRMILPARFEEGGPKDSIPRLLRNALGVTKRLRAAKSNEKKTHPLCRTLPLHATLELTKGLYSKAIAQLQAPPREALPRALARNQGKRHGV